jgi:hypothetical protein
MKTLILFLISFSAFSQIDFNDCSINIINNERIEVGFVTGYSNIVLLQSGTSLTIKEFNGTTMFVHGYKALEDESDYIKPTLTIKQCLNNSVIYLSNRIRFNERPLWNVISLFPYVVNTSNCKTKKFNQ